MDNSNGNGDILRHLYEQLGKVVLLPIPLGKKGPIFKGWQSVTYEQTQTDAYQLSLQMAIRRGGNIGVLLGKPSDGLRTIDFDDEEDFGEFVGEYPWAEEVFRTRGAHGFQIWFRSADAPERRMVLKKIEDKPVLEFRGGGGIQSVSFGRHPDGMRYRIVVDVPVRNILFREIREWIDKFDTRQNGESSKDYSWLGKFPGCNIKELDLVGLLGELGITCRSTDIRDKYAITCPWCDTHTTSTDELDTTIWQWGKDRWPSFHCLHAHCDGKTLEHLLLWAEGFKGGIVKRYCRGKKDKLPPTVSYDDIIAAEPKLPPELIAGLLHQGMKMMMSGPSKMRKTWVAMDLGIALAVGGLWLDFDTCQTKLLFLNMEMPQVFFDWRLYHLQRALKIGKMAAGAFNALHLRGSHALDEDWNELAKRAREEGYGAIIIDPIYKVLGARDENSAKDIANLLRNVDMVAEASGAAVIEIHHFAKGDSSEKDVGDRASGSGVFFRDPDAWVTISPANKERQEDEARIDVRARMVPLIDPFAIRWSFPIWKRDGSIDIGKTKKETKLTQDQIILSILNANPQGLIYKEWQQIAEVTYLIGRNSFNYALKNIKDKVRQQGRKYFPKQV